MKEIKYLPDIYDYLEENSVTNEISIQNLERIILKIRALTGIPYEDAEILLKTYFTVMREELLKGSKLTMLPVAWFYLNKSNEAIYPYVKLKKKYRVLFKNEKRNARDRKQ